MQTVLVVDDEPDVRLVARVVLATAGFDVTEADCGEQALEALALARPDAVLLDVRMPGIDGWEVLRRIRTQADLADLPVVVFTAHLTAREEAPAELKDYRWVLHKPFKPDDLVAAVELAMTNPEAGLPL